MEIWHLIVAVAPVILGFVLNEIIIKRKQRQRLEQKVDDLKDCFLLYVKTNGAKPEVKNFIEKKLGGK